ncbi:MAG TPA: hypothetical protein VIE66_02595 [Methylocella sp.]|jgi:hypothetical protein
MAEVECQEKIVSDLEQDLARATAARLEVLGTVRQVSTAVDEKREVAAKLAPLNKRVKELSIAIVSMTQRLADERRTLDLAKNQQAERARIAAAAANASLLKDKVFEVVAPDGRAIRHLHASAEALRSELLPGYAIRGRVYGADKSGHGGFCVSLATSAADLEAALATITEGV